MFVNSAILPHWFWGGSPRPSPRYNDDQVRKMSTWNQVIYLITWKSNKICFRNNVEKFRNNVGISLILFRSIVPKGKNAGGRSDHHQNQVANFATWKQAGHRVSSLQKGITKMVRVSATRTKIKGRISPLERKATCLLQQIARLFIIWYSSIYCLYYTQSSVICQYVWEYFKHKILIKHKRAVCYSSPAYNHRALLYPLYPRYTPL